MPDEKLPLIVHPGSGLVHVGPQGGRIVAEMVSGALALSRAIEETTAALVPRFNIGEHVFCEPDYRQILLWAKSLELEPETVIERLQAEPEMEMDWLLGGAAKYKTQFAEGRIIQLGWNIDLLPLNSFEWVAGLVIKSVAFFVCIRDDGCVMKERILSLSLPELRYLACGNMGLIGLDIFLTKQLTKLECHGNKLTKLDLSEVPQLTELFCTDNQLAELDLSSAPHLTVLCCDHNQLTELDLAAVPQLTELYCGYNQLTKLDLSSVPQLTKLCCDSSRLTEIDLSNVPQITDLACGENPLSQLDLSNVPQLNDLYCYSTYITKLDLSKTPNLTKLNCSLNAITKLDLSDVRQLTELACGVNELVELDIRPLEKLLDLSYDDGKTRLIQRTDQNF